MYVSKVSVIMPCYNDGKYILESIASVKNQTYKNIELIIVNDGSTDEYTNNLLKSDELKNIKIINSKNLGPAHARNLAIKESEGKYILPLDSDDLIDKTYIEKAVKILDENNNVGVVYCRADLFGEKQGRWDLPDYSLKKMLLDNIVFVTSVFRKEDWVTVNGFDTKMKHGMEDYDFWLSILEIGREIYQIHEILFHYRIKKSSRTTEFQKNVNTVVDTYMQIYDNHPILYKKYYDIYAKILRKELINQIFANRLLKESTCVIEKMSKIRILKKIYKKIIKRS
ncbi:glycosyltransferase family A protein [Clostridium sp. BJN0001]|uniref:glycosyltransferase family 2 protein n=1 Tax=Clostridium sp. BJN0001 TaxID=2930219 RepID=UPI001FD18F29|nr:glycosyltransferase family A protein [Clostridium sp. BJN0001]